MNRYWTLAGRPLGELPSPEDFELREAPIPVPGPNQMLTRTIYLSLDPYQWVFRQGGREQPGQVAHARTVSQVVESRIDGFRPGDVVFNTNGWQDYGLTGEGIEHAWYMFPRKLDPSLGRISLSVGVLGMLGLTAYSGMLLLAEPRAGETVVVSAASGGVGQIAGQLAKLRGARVVGVAGSEAKRRFVVEELGFDACVSHLSDTLADDLKAACPNGVDVYFENVGGKVFEAVIPLVNQGGRVTVCGTITHYTAGGAPEPDPKGALARRAQAMLASRGVKVFDLFVGEFVPDHQDRFIAEMAGWVAAGKVKYREDIRQGLEAAPQAFADMMRGANFGKMLVQVSDDPGL